MRLIITYAYLRLYTSTYTPTFWYIYVHIAKQLLNLVRHQYLSGREQGTHTVATRWI